MSAIKESEKEFADPKLLPSFASPSIFPFQWLAKYKSQVAKAERQTCKSSHHLNSVSRLKDPVALREQVQVIRMKRKQSSKRSQARNMIHTSRNLRRLTRASERMNNDESKRLRSKMDRKRGRRAGRRDCRMNGEVQGEEKKSDKSSRVQNDAFTAVDHGISGCPRLTKGESTQGRGELKRKNASAIPLSPATATQLVPLSPRTIVPLRTAICRSIT